MEDVIKFEQKFDEAKKLQYINDETSVLHCHHYAGLVTRLALDMTGLGGPELLFESMEEAAFLTLTKYCLVEKIKTSAEKQRVAEQYFALTGLGLLSLSVSGDGGRAEMKHSHVDDGWVKKWKRESRPVNFIGCGYIAAAFSVINNRSIGYYDVSEVKSIVKGDSTSVFNVVKKG